MSGPATEAAAPPRGALRTAVADLGQALGFLTILPLRLRDPGARGLDGAAAFFPLVGALIGALAGAVRALGADPLGVPVASVLGMLVLVAVTGALHLDGLADTADGIGARGGGPARRLAAMRDSATGVFGVLALLGWALLLTSALASLSDRDALVALVAAGAVSRSVALVHAAAEEPARQDGLGAAFRVTPAALGAATTTAVLVAPLLCGIGPGFAVLGAGLAVAVATTLLARRLLGGRTGDTIGATVALAEVAVVLTLLAIWHG
jgi:adenosylcobinamide-GDP ribazoletransferase